jgi:hypothetical protein
MNYSSTPQTQNSSTSASTDNTKIGITKTVSRPLAPGDEGSDRMDRADIKTNKDSTDKERMGKRREALNKAQTAKKAANRAGRKEQFNFKGNKNSQ